MRRTTTVLPWMTAVVRAGKTFGSVCYCMRRVSPAALAKIHFTAMGNSAGAEVHAPRP